MHAATAHLSLLSPAGWPAGGRCSYNVLSVVMRDPSDVQELQPSWQLKQTVFFRHFSQKYPTGIHELVVSLSLVFTKKMKFCSCDLASCCAYSQQGALKYHFKWFAFFQPSTPYGHELRYDLLQHAMSLIKQHTKTVTQIHLKSFHPFGDLSMTP